MARQPFKIVRFLVWCTADRDNKDDILTTLDDVFGEKYKNYGALHAHLWSISQALRSLPYGLIANILQIALSIWALGG